MLDEGTRLGPYTIVVHVGTGGMGEVYRARDTRLERDVAIKVLPQHFSQNPAALRRFQFSNFAGKGPISVGSLPGITTYGAISGRPSR
jgi:serine/threonine protein kinase